MKSTYKQRARIVGILIVAAYSMLAYSITEDIIVGLITDIISGLAVIGISILMFPIFASRRNNSLKLLASLL